MYFIVITMRINHIELVDKCILGVVVVVIAW